VFALVEREILKHRVSLILVDVFVKHLALGHLASFFVVFGEKLPRGLCIFLAVVVSSDAVFFGQEAILSRVSEETIALEIVHLSPICIVVFVKRTLGKLVEISCIITLRRLFIEKGHRATAVETQATGTRKARRGLRNTHS